MPNRLLAFAGAVALSAACDGGSLQPNGGTAGRAGPGIGVGGGAGSASGPGIGACAGISVEPDVFNPCGRTTSMAFSPDGRLLATGTQNERPNAHLWRLSDGGHVREVDGVGGATYGIAFSPDGSLLSTAGGYDEAGGALHTSPEIVKLWNVADGSMARVIPAGCGSYATTAAFSHDGTLLVTAGEHGPVEVWRVIDGSLFASLSYPTTVDNAHFAPNDTQIIVAGVDRRASVWNLADGAVVSVFDVADAMADAAYSPDGAEIATTGDGNILGLWDARTGARLESMPGHDASVSHVVWVGQNRLISNDWSGIVRSWTRNGSGALILSGTWTTRGRSLGIAVSADQKLLVAGGADPATGVEGFVFLPL